MPSAFAARAVLFAIACSVLGACATAPLPEQPGHPYCTAQEHEAAVCEQLRRAVLIEPDGKRIPLDVAKCSGGQELVHVILERRDTGAFLYRGAMSFAVAEPRAPMSPRRIEPDISEWPCTDDSCRSMRELAPGSRIAVPVVQQCPGAPQTETTEVIVPLPPASVRSCADGRSPRWCVDPGDGTERYRIYQYPRFSWVPRQTVIEVREGIVSVQVEGEAARVLSKEEHDVILPSLEEVWRVPPTGGGSCRHGPHMMIKARKPGAFRVVERSCSSIGGLWRVLPR